MSSSGHFTSDAISNAVMHGEFMAFAIDDESIATIRAWVERQGYPAATVQQGGPDMFAQMLESAAPPKIALIDIDGQSDPVSAAARLIELCGSESKIIIIGSANDVDLYRRMLGVGIVDYLVKSLSIEALNQTIAKALRNNTTKQHPREAKIVVIIGVRGGVGASTITSNIGWLLAHEFKLNCALLDLDLQFGTTALSLDLEPGRGLRDIVSSPHRVDGLMIASSMTSESDQFSVLGAEEAVDEVTAVDSAAISALLKEMTGNFDYILVDLPRHMLATQKRLLATTHEVVLATELSLAGIRDTLRIKTALANLGSSAKLSVVASRIDATHAGQIDMNAFEKGAQIKIDLTIPQDTKLMTEAANSGKALGAIAPEAPITHAMRALASKISGKISQTKNLSFSQIWKKFLSLAAAKKAAFKTEHKS